MCKSIFHVWVSACLILVNATNATVYRTRFANVTWDDDNWILQSTYPEPGRYQARASLANGYIGINLASLGPFFEADLPVNGDNINGWPLFDRRQTFATIAGFYDVQPTTEGTNFAWLNQLGGESVISGIPHWSGLTVQQGNYTFNASTDLAHISNYSATLNIRSASLTWQLTWSPPGLSPIDILYSVFVNKLYVNHAAVRLQLRSQKSVNVTVVDILDGDGALRTQFVGKSFEQDSNTIWTAVQPLNIPYVTAFVYSTITGDINKSSDAMGQGVAGHNVSSISQSVLVNLTPGQDSVVDKHIGIASSDAFDDPKSIAQNASISGAEVGYTALFTSHVSEWRSIMPEDSVDRYSYADGSILNNSDIIEQQILAVTNPFYMLQNTVGQNAVDQANNNEKLISNSISVCGLGSECYAGLVFWDVEVWMQPGLVVAFPEATRQIANYRADRYETAKLNVKEAYITSQNKTTFSNNSAIFSWTSGRFGNCTGTGPCFDYEYHINGDIALQLQNHYVATGDTNTFKENYFPIFDSVAQVYSDLLYFNQSTGTYMLANATDPDEYANAVDNPGYTMVLIKTILDAANKYRTQFGMQANTTWTTQAQNIEIPLDAAANIYLEYTGMNGSISVKQADVVLIDDFLHYENPYTISDLEFYAGRQSQNGPGMTYGVFSVIAARSLPSGCADFTYNLYGSSPYVRAPWFQFSEQLIDDYSTNGGTHPAYPFLTGMGGANRVAVFGFLGLDLQQESFNINPTLPPQVDTLSYRIVYWQGHAIKAVANQTHTTLTRLPERSLRTAQPSFSEVSIPVTIGADSKDIRYLPLNDSLVISNRRAYLNATVPDNIAQCAMVTSDSDFAPGQFPLSAVDGAVSTKWQPVASNVSSKLNVFLGGASIRPISGFSFNWAQAPPRYWSVAFSNSTDPSSYPDIMQVASSSNVTISNPYNSIDAAKITPYIGNTTNVTLSEPVYSGAWAILTIRGTHADDAQDSPGATVAEWAIIAANDSQKIMRFSHTEL